MSLQLSVAARNAQLDSLETTIGTSPILRVKTGAPPANCAAADTGTVLASMTLPSDWAAAASGGSKAKDGTWNAPAVAASGYAAHWRMYASDGTTCHMQGAVGMTADAWTSGTAYTVNQVVANGGKIYVCTTAGTSAGSGGPTGTTTGITDNTAVWNYVCPETGELTVDSALMIAGQSFTVTDFTLTADNA